MSYQPDLQCVRVSKVYDWVNQLTNIKLKEKVPTKKGTCIQDNICLKFNLPCDGTKSALWSGIDLKGVVSTFVVVIDKRCKGEVDLFINGEYMKTLIGGQSISATITDLQLIEAQCKDSPDIDYCKGSLDIQLVYSPKKTEEECKGLNCYLSDQKGNPVNFYEEGAICCVEHSNPSKRKNVEVVMNGQVVELQAVEILIKGFVTVEFLNERGKRCGSCVFPFWEVETLYLCAPTGTNICCSVSKMECKADYIAHEQKCKCCRGISIRIETCLNIYSTASVTLEMQGKECEPRFELKDVCSTIPIPESCVRTNVAANNVT